MIKASEHDYLSTISELQINSQYAAAFMSGRIQLHMVRGEKIFDFLNVQNILIID